MPTYKVVRKPFWTVDGPVHPGETIELAEHIAGPFVPGNLEPVGSGESNPAEEPPRGKQSKTAKEEPEK